MAKTNVRGAQIADGASGVDLTVDVTGTLPVANGGTGVATLGSGNVVVGAGTSAVTSSKAAPSGAFVGDTDTQALTNKTLTSPKMTDILDSNGNEVLYLPATASAVNYMALTNAAAGGDPTFNAQGSDTDIGIAFIPKGAAHLDAYARDKTSLSWIVTGTQTDIDWNMQTKGAGVLKENGVAVVKTTATQTLTGKTLSDTFMGELFDAQKTQRDTVLLASNDFSVESVLEISSTTSLEVPSTSTLEIITYPGRRIFGQSVAATSVTINTDVYERYLLSGLAAGVTVTLSGMGGRVLVGFKDNGTSRAVTWGNAQSSGAATLLAATVINKTHWVGLVHDGSTWTCLAVDATGY